MPPLRKSLSVELTRFIGREAELSEARDLLRRSRLVTMTGVGGTGKTRLALRLVAEVQGEFRHGATVAELAPVSDATLISQAVSQALGLVDGSQRGAEDALLAALDDAEALLVLDNCEHLVEACAHLVERLLKRCSGMQILTTSREPLGVPGEITFAVPALSLPSLSVATSRPEVMRSDAVQLFADRAGAARPEFVVDDTNVELVARVCHRLDGLPLAIELAAALVRAMPLDEVLARLDNRFSLLIGGHRTAEARHQTLAATIDWSHALLSDQEAVLFRRLSVFAGGWRLTDAEDVCADELLPRERIVGIHTRLVEKSLIAADLAPLRTARLRFLETIREYALWRASGADELEVLRHRHFTHFLQLAEQYYTQRISGGSDGQLPVLAAHRDNFRQALTWAEKMDPTGALRLASALDDFWRMVSGAEGWQWLRRLLPRVSATSPARLRALLTAGWLAAYAPDYAEGGALVREALDITRRTGDRANEAWAETCLGRLAFFGGDPPSAQVHLKHALATHEELGNPLGRVRVLCLLGLIEALMLGQATLGEEKLSTAQALACDIGDRWGEGYADLMLGLTAADAMDRERAARHSRAALDVASLGPLLGVPLVVMAAVAVEDDPARAARLLGAASAHFDRTGTTAPGFVLQRAQTVQLRVEHLLGSETARRILDDGRQMGSDEAVAYALSGATVEPVQRPGGLTRREIQVATLVGREQTNRDIARILFVSVRTAESHVDHILTKLGLRNRKELSAWAGATGYWLRTAHRPPNSYAGNIRSRLRSRPDEPRPRSFIRSNTILARWTND